MDSYLVKNCKINFCFEKIIDNSHLLADYCNAVLPYVFFLKDYDILY